MKLWYGSEAWIETVKQVSNPMKLLAWLTETFIAVFGITHPEPEQEKLANVLIGGFLLAVILGAFGAVGVMVYLISRH